MDLGFAAVSGGVEDEWGEDESPVNNNNNKNNGAKVDKKEVSFSWISLVISRKPRFGRRRSLPLPALSWAMHVVYQRIEEAHIFRVDVP